jgi:hypothetical protein
LFAVSIEITIYADANSKATAAAASLLEAVGPIFVLPGKTPGVATPPMGLIAVRDATGTCLDFEASFGEPDPPPPPSWRGAPHGGLPPGIWGHWRLYPEPSLLALGVLARFAAQTSARVWVVCNHERGDSPYDEWAWLFAPARPRSPAYEHVYAYGGDAGQILWQRDLIGPDPWRVLADSPASSPSHRLVQHLGLRGGGLPGRSLDYGQFRRFRVDR